MSQLNPKIVRLSTTTWAKAYFGTHYYGRYHYIRNHPHDRNDVTVPLTAKTAGLLNKERKDYEVPYEVGEDCIKFFSEKEMREAARRQWQMLFPQAEILIEGDNCLCDPSECIDAINPEIKKTWNGFWERFEALNGWGYSYEKRDPEKDEQTQAVCDEWEAWCKENGLSRYIKGG